MHIGIDLGTTFCCVAYVDEDGIAKVIPNSDGDFTTPSVIWFDGNTARVGKKADIMKSFPGMAHHIKEFVKRDIGKPIMVDNQIQQEDPLAPLPAPYEVGGFKFGAAGMSAIILRKLKIDAINYLKRKNLIDENATEKNYRLDAIITVPASFGYGERKATMLAGLAAGLNVIGIIKVNE